MKIIKQLLCKHDWDNGENTPFGQSFICAKCNKVIWFNPVDGWWTEHWWSRWKKFTK